MVKSSRERDGCNAMFALLVLSTGPLATSQGVQVTDILSPSTVRPVMTSLTNTPRRLRYWQAGDHSRAFEPLMDRITHVAALAGSLAGFDGHVLEVRSAGEDAWLCKPAPSDPLIDQPDEADEETAMVSAR